MTADNPRDAGASAPGNTWLCRSDHLAPAYLQRAGAPWNLRFELVTRGLQAHIPQPRARIADVGGGCGRQAVMLARLGHEVVVLDPDPVMLAAATELAGAESRTVRDRLSFVKGLGENAARLIGTGFDVVCCHSLLMYLTDPMPMLAELVRLASPGGLISLLALNADAIAMRSGLERRWTEALATLRSGAQTGEHYLPSRADRREDLSDELARLGAAPRQWYGVGIFGDHLGPADFRNENNDIKALAELEWLAGQRDPYRLVARTFHLIAERVSAIDTGT